MRRLNVRVYMEETAAQIRITAKKDPGFRSYGRPGSFGIAVTL